MRSPSGLVRVTAPKKVDRIVRWFDRLPTVRPGIFSCPALVYGRKITLAFRDADGVVARARYAADWPNHSLVSSQCTPISFRGGRGKPKGLIGGRILLRVQRLLDVRLLG